MSASKAKFYWKYLFFLFQQSKPVLRGVCRPVSVCVFPHLGVYCLGGPMGTSRIISE